MAKKADKKTVKTKTAAKAKTTKTTKTAKKAVSASSSKAKKTTAPKAKTVKATKTRAKSTTKKAASSKIHSTREVEVISPTKKVKKIQGYSKKDLEDFKKIILEKRNEIIEQLQNLKEQSIKPYFLYNLKEQMMDPTTGQYVNENSPYSLHMAEQGTDAMEREKLYLWAQRENKFLGYLDDALQRIDNGSFGICIECIDEPQHLCATCPLIPKDRLMAVPHTQHCLQVKQKMQTNF